MGEIYKTQTFHKFLKSYERSIPGVGDYLPSFIVNETDNIYGFITDYLVIVALSTTCYPCKTALTVLQKFVDNISDINVVVMIDTDEGSLEQIKNLFKNNINIFIASNEIIRTYFQGVPWGISVNSKGQILGSYAFDSLEWFNKIIYPVKKFISDNEE